MKCVAYLRASSAGETDGYPLASQRFDIHTWARRNGHRVTRWCSDRDVSGTVEAWERAGLACALNAIQGGAAQALVVPRLDRLASYVTTQEATLALVWRLDGLVFSVDTGEVKADDAGDPMRTAMRQMAAALAQLERLMIRSRMATSSAAKAANGGDPYRAPSFGYRSQDGVLVPDEGQQPMLQRILELHAEGLNPRRIADRLAAEGHRPNGAERFFSASIARIIKAATSL